MIEAALYQRLQSLAAGRVFFGVAPEGTQAPFIVCTRISGVHDWALAGPTAAQRWQVQVDCYATTLLAAAQLSEQAFSALSPTGADFGCGPVTELPNDFDETAGLHRASAEYTLQT